MEGPSNDANVLALRARLKRNYLTILFLAQGVPMLLGGDEFGRTQKGNNNAYCQDNEISWVNWQLAEQNRDFLRFVRLLIQFRQKHETFHRKHFHVQTLDGIPEMSWHGLKVGQPDWSEDSKWLGLLYSTFPKTGDPDFYLMFNADASAKRFELPKPRNGFRWHLILNTYNQPPKDIFEEEKAPLLKNQAAFELQSYSSAVLIGKK